MVDRQRGVLAALLLGLVLFWTAAPAPGFADSTDQPAQSEVVVDPRVVGGGAAGVGEYPYFVSVQTSSTFEHFCGGSLISAARVLTAAHCVDTRTAGSVRVVIGRTSLFDTSQGIVRLVSAIDVHPDWSRSTLRYDTAVLTLASPVTNADNTARGIEWLRLAEGAESGQFEPGDPLWIIGHGATCESCFGSSTLLEASLPAVADETMSSIYGSFFDPATMTGAGPMEGGTDACFGDSGGPLLVPGGGIDIQVGSTSWGVGCARPDRPGGYGRVWDGSMRAFVDAHVPRPANDRFAAAEVLPGDSGSVPGNNTSATSEPGEAADHETSVWYSWTPSASGPAAVSAATTGFDSTLQVYTGSSTAGLTLVASSTSTSGDSAVNFDAVAGTTYRIAVDGHSFGFGSFVLGYATNVATPVVSIGDVTVPEGNSGTRNAIFTVSLAEPSGFPVTVPYATASAGATAGSDYTAKSGTVSLAPGTTSATVKVPVAGDTADEPNEGFTVTLSAVAGVTLADGTGAGTIADDDPLPVAKSLSVGDVRVHEGNGGTRTAVFTVSLAKPSTATVSVAFATANGTAGKLADYVKKTGKLTFAPGVTGMTVKVIVNPDTAAESDETFVVNLSSPYGATVADGSGTATIVDDD